MLLVGGAEPQTFAAAAAKTLAPPLQKYHNTRNQRRPVWLCWTVLQRTIWFVRPWLKSFLSAYTLL